MYIVYKHSREVFLDYGYFRVVREIEKKTFRRHRGPFQQSGIIIVQYDLLVSTRISTIHSSVCELGVYK